MKFIRFETERIDSHAMVYGCGRPIGVHYSKPTQPAAMYLKTPNHAWYYSFKEYADLAKALINPTGDLPSSWVDLGIEFSYIGFKESGIRELFPKNYWDLTNDEYHPTFFWSGHLGNNRQANRKEIMEMLRKLLQPKLVAEFGQYKMYSFQYPEYQWNAEALHGVVLRNNQVVSLLGMPEKYLIDQFSSGFCQSGNWCHKNGSGVHIFNGKQWSVESDTHMSFKGKTKGAANQKLLKFLRSHKGKGYNPIWAKLKDWGEDSGKVFCAAAHR